MKVLFVCLGNICRSPSAESVMNKMLKEKGLEGQVFTESAGTSALHEGELPDPRSIVFGKKRGLEFKTRSRPVAPEDFKKFDAILAMDKSNYRNLLNLCPNEEYRSKILMMCDFCQTRKEKEVPDPYYGGEAGFDHVLDILEDACAGFLAKKFGV